jgi:hypothetical protein
MCLSNLRKSTPEAPKSSVPVLSAQKPLFFWQIFIQIIVSLSVHIARLCWTVDSKSRLKVPLLTDAWELNAKTVRSIGKDARRRVPSPTPTIDSSLHHRLLRPGRSGKIIFGDLQVVGSFVA